MPTKIDHRTPHAFTVTEAERIRTAQHTIATRVSLLLAVNDSVSRDDCNVELYSGIKDLLLEIAQEAHAIGLILSRDPERLE